MNLSNLANQRNMPYSTVRKYVSALAEMGFIFPKVTSHSVMLRDSDVEIFDRFLSLIRSGISFKNALKQLGESGGIRQDNVVSYLQRLERKVDSLEEENRRLRELVQVYLSKVDDLQNQLMPSRKKGWFFKILKPKK